MKINFIILSIFTVSLIPTAFAAPQIQQWQTSNGVKTLFVAAPELPMLDVAITFDAGSGRDANLPGLSQLTHSMLNAGTVSMTADDIAEKFEDVGAKFGASASLDRSSISLRSLTDEELLNSALATFVEIISQPSFPEKDFLRIKNQALIAIKDSSQRPGEMANRAFYKAIYNDHPYANPTLGYKQTIEAIQLRDVKNFHQQYFVAHNALIAMVGGVDLAKAKEIAEQISTSLLQGTKPAALPKPEMKQEVEDIYIPFPSQQAHVYLGKLGIQRGNQDYFALYVGNHVLGGGGFTSRLVKEVRVARGLSYSVYSYFFPLLAPGTFTLGLQTRTDQAKQAADVSLQTINKFLSEGPSEEELSLAKNNIIGGFPLRIDSNRDILGYLSLIGYYQLPLNYLETFTQNITAITQEQIRNAFAKHLDTNKLVTIIVGGPESGIGFSGQQ